YLVAAQDQRHGGYGAAGILSLRGHGEGLVHGSGQSCREEEWGECVLESGAQEVQLKHTIDSPGRRTSVWEAMLSM
ncbi:hypothetical protein INR49_004458, partial [Caranx melampygus]